MPLRGSLPEKLPDVSMYSLNVNGMLVRGNMTKSGTIENKIKLIKSDLIKTEKPAIVFLQETHWSTVAQARIANNMFGGNMRGLALSDDPGRKGVAAIIPKGSPLEGLVTDISADPGGRWALIRLDAKTQFYHILNVYAPTNERAKPAFYRRLLGKFSAYSNLICVGDWNYIDSPEDLAI